jgi:hypothetical protein
VNADPVMQFIDGLAADPSWVLPAAICLVATWCLSLLGMGGLTGWRRLASRYPALPFDGQRILPGWVIVRWIGYRNLMVMRAGKTHLHVKVWLRLGHPPFSVPWDDIRVERRSSIGRLIVVLRFAREPRVSLSIYPLIAERLAAASDGRLRLPP